MRDRNHKFVDNAGIGGRGMSGIMNGTVYTRRRRWQMQCRVWWNRWDRSRGFTRDDDETVLWEGARGPHIRLRMSRLSSQWIYG